MTDFETIKQTVIEHQRNSELSEMRQKEADQQIWDALAPREKLERWIKTLQDQLNKTTFLALSTAQRQEIIKETNRYISEAEDKDIITSEKEFVEKVGLTESVVPDIRVMRKDLGLGQDR